MTTAELIEKLERAEEEIYRQWLQIENLKRRQRVGEDAIQIVAALSALVPLRDSLAANQNGQTLVDYFRAALKAKEADNGKSC